MIPVRDTIPHRHTPVVTWALIAVNIIVFFYELSLEPEDLERLFYLFGVVPARYTHPEWALQIGLPVDDYWPFLTCMFLHGGWGHVIGNMWTLWIFGDNVEDRMGPGRFLIFYLLMGVLAGVTHWFTNAQSAVPTVGASGAIAGVLGAYLRPLPALADRRAAADLLLSLLLPVARGPLSPLLVPQPGAERDARRLVGFTGGRNRVLGARGGLRRRRRASPALHLARTGAPPALRARRVRHRGGLGEPAVKRTGTPGEPAWTSGRSSGCSSFSRRCSR